MSWIQLKLSLSHISCQNTNPNPTNTNPQSYPTNTKAPVPLFFVFQFTLNQSKPRAIGGAYSGHIRGFLFLKFSSTNPSRTTTNTVGIYFLIKSSNPSRTTTKILFLTYKISNVCNYICLVHRLKTKTETQGISKNSPKSASDSSSHFFFFFFSKPWAMKLSLSSAQRPLNAQIYSEKKHL